MDFSQSMEINSRVKFAINAYLEFFDNYLFEKDRIAMLRFNNMIHIDFELNQKGQNEVFLRRSIQDIIDKEPKGETSLYTGIYEALKIFQ